MIIIWVVHVSDGQSVREQVKHSTDRSEVKQRTAHETEKNYHFAGFLLLLFPFCNPAIDRPNVRTGEIFSTLLHILYQFSFPNRSLQSLRSKLNSNVRAKRRARLFPSSPIRKLMFTFQLNYARQEHHPTFWINEWMNAELRKENNRI